MHYVDVERLDDRLHGVRGILPELGEDVAVYPEREPDLTVVNTRSTPSRSSP